MQGEREGEGIEACPWCGVGECFRYVEDDFQGSTVVHVECECGARGPRSLSDNQGALNWNRVAASARLAAMANERVWCEAILLTEDPTMIAKITKFVLDRRASASSQPEDRAT